MNAGAHGGETAAQFLSARAVDRMGNIHQLTPDDMEYSYRHCGVPKDYIFTEALFAGKKGNEAELQRQMQDVVDYREENQPVKSRTGGSTFKNPPGSSAWKLIDAAGCRGLQVGGAQVSEKHCNFLINTGNATAADIEELGEMVRKRVKENSGVELYWEIKRVGIVG
jgi:UDP-N-acetylmuramate dehydrogenase